jgi:hypothetical protein
LLIKAGAEGKNMVFLFSDNQIKDESFMEDISMILNTGDVPNLYPADEKAEIIEKMQTVARNEAKKIDATPLAMYNYFIERVRENLHVVLAMSPIGDAFRNRLRMFPSLINCCTIDWFQVRQSVNSCTIISASARISKGQGYQCFLRKRAGSSFGQQRAICCCTRKNLKNGQNFTTFMVNKMFSHKFFLMELVS